MLLYIIDEETFASLVMFRSSSSFWCYRFRTR